MRERIRNMLMKSSDRGASPAERESAKRMAEKLMRKHGISENDLADTTPEKIDWQKTYRKSFSDF